MQEIQGAPHQAMMDESGSGSGSESPAASTHNDEAESLENQQSWYIGQCYKCFCFCCAVCGPAPHMVLVEQGSVGVVTKFGKFSHLLPPGRHSRNVMAENVVAVNLKQRFIDVRPQEIMTADKLTIRIDAVCYFKVLDARQAMFSVDNYEFALGNLAQVTLRTVLGENTLAEIFGQRQKLNARLKQLLDEASDPWGIQVGLVELKGIELDPGMQRAMASKAEAHQMAEAKIIQSRAQRDAASILADAAGQMEQQPAALKLQWMETLRSMSTTGRNPMVIVPQHMKVTAALAAKAVADQSIVAMKQKMSMTGGMYGGAPMRASPMPAATFGGADALAFPRLQDTAGRKKKGKKKNVLDFVAAVLR